MSYEGHLFFGKRSKSNLNLENPKKIEKTYLVSEISGSENVALNSLSEEGKTCHWQSTG